MNDPAINVIVRIQKSDLPKLEAFAGSVGAEVKTKSRKKLTSEDIAEMRRLFVEDGFTQIEIGARYGLSPFSVKEYLRGFSRKKTAKELKPKNPVGRPRLTPDQKRVRTVGDEILGYYSRIKADWSPRYKEDYVRCHAKYEQALAKAVEEFDIETVNWFDSVKPWHLNRREPAGDPPNMARPDGSTPSLSESAG